MTNRRNDLHGIALLDKPTGITSAGVVRRVKRQLGGAKVGHLGTLDPFATGLLPLCIGEGSKLAPFLNDAHKSYDGLIQLGRATDTLDPTGEEIERAEVMPFDAARLEEVAKSFLGEREQVPPMHSAVKHEGVRLYRLARKGVEVERRPRRISILRLELEGAGPKAIRLTVRCSKGTYVRTLAAEIARALGTVATLAELRRIEFGHFSLSEATPLEAIEAGEIPRLVSLRDALPEIREHPVSPDVEARLTSGQQAVLRSFSAPSGPADRAKVVSADGHLIAILDVAEKGTWKIARVFSRH